MQLTANFVLLATALAYGSSSVLALPVGSSFAAREVEAREFQDELSYAREVPESMYLDARSFFGDYENMDARAIPADSAPVSAAAVTPATPASAVAPGTPVTTGVTDVKGIPEDEAGVEHKPFAKHALGEKEPKSHQHEVSGARRPRTREEEKRRHQLYLASLTPEHRRKVEEREAFLASLSPEKRRKWLAAYYLKQAHDRSLRMARKGASPRNLRTQRAKGGEKATSRSAITSPEGEVKKASDGARLPQPATDGIPATGSSINGASAKLSAPSASVPK